MYYINELLKKSRPKTFMDYAPGKIPKKPTKAQEPLTLGEVAPKATERVAPRVTAKEESTYTTSDKDLQNIHKNRTYSSYRKSAQTNVGAGVSARPNSRTTLRKAPTQKPQPIKLPYRPSVQGPPKMTKLPYIPAQDGPPKMTQYGKQTAPAYDSPVKIVGDNVMEKDYEDFWEAFRKESTADKLNWAANQLQQKPEPQKRKNQPAQQTESRDDYDARVRAQYAAREKKKDTAVSDRSATSQDMMQWSMRQIEGIVKPKKVGRKRYIADEDESFRQGFFGEDYKNNEELQQRVNSAIRDREIRRAGDILRTYLKPENNIATRYTENAYERPLRKRYDIPEPGRYGRLSTEEGQKALDDISLGLSVGSLIPGADTFTDLASIPVDLLRGDYISAVFDAVGLIPLYGEVGDAAKLARIGANAIDTANDARRAVKAGAELIENTDDVIDFAKYTDDINLFEPPSDKFAEQLIEESERIRSSIDYAIKKDLTSSGEFVRKFNTITDDSNIRREIYNEVKDILHHRSGTNGEDLLYYNPRLKKWYRSRSGIEAGKPAYTDDIILGLKENANNELIAFHNHPAGMPPSVEDLNAALKNGYAKGYTIGHNGRIFEYTAPRERISAKCYEISISAYLDEGYSEFEAQYMTMQDLSRLYGFYFREVK